MAAVPTALSDWYSTQQASPGSTTTNANTSGLLSATSSNPVIPSTTAQATNASTTTTPIAKAPVTTLSSVAMDNAKNVADPNTWNITPDQTVAGQLDKNLSSGSSLMQQANTQGLETANSRGLLNSSMAAGASENAMIASAMPIATADANANLGINRYNTDTVNTNNIANANAANNAEQVNANAINNSNQYNATANNEIGKFNATASNNANQFNATQANDLSKFNAAADNTTSQFNAGNTFTQQQSLFDANVKSSLAQIDNQAGFTKQSQQLYAGLSDGFNKSITSINQDVNMNQQSKDYSIQQLYNAYKAQISILSAVGSIPDVSQLLTNNPTA